MGQRHQMAGRPSNGQQTDGPMRFIGERVSGGECVATRQLARHFSPEFLLFYERPTGLFLAFAFKVEREKLRCPER